MTLAKASSTDLLIFSHISWSSHDYKRIHFLANIFAEHRRVFYVENEVAGDLEEPFMKVREVQEGMVLLTPHLPSNLNREEKNQTLRYLIDLFLDENQVSRHSTWYFGAMAFGYTKHLISDVVIYDCVDEYHRYSYTNESYVELEMALLEKADLVFASSFLSCEMIEKKKSRVHVFKNLLDLPRFKRTSKEAPVDLKGISGPRFVLSGIFDKGLDLTTLIEISEQRPNYQIILMGPVLETNLEGLLKQPNIHYLGVKSYEQLPQYYSAVHGAMILFSGSKSLRLTKALEFMAAGLPIISTLQPSFKGLSQDGEEDLLFIVKDTNEIIKYMDKIASRTEHSQTKVESFLMDLVYRNEWMQIAALEKKCLESKSQFRKLFNFFINEPPRRSFTRRFKMAKSNNRNDGRRTSSRSGRSSSSSDRKTGARGFAAMNPEEHRRISAMGGHASHGSRSENSRSSRSRTTASR